MHMVISIPPKYSVSQVVGYVKGKSAIWVARSNGEEPEFCGSEFLGTGLLCFNGRTG